MIRNYLLAIGLLFPMFLFSQLDTSDLNVLNKDGLKTGVWREVHEEKGKYVLMYITYEEGIKNGPYIACHEDKKTIYVKGQFRNDTLDGTIEIFFSNGKLEHKYTKSNNKFVGHHIRYNESGTINEESFYNDEGVKYEYKWYWANGNLRLHKKYFISNSEMKYGAWHYENGNIKDEVIISEGETIGLRKEYSIDGSLINESDYHLKSTSNDY